MISALGTRQAGQRAAVPAAQLVLLALLWLSVGLGPVGWLTGLGYSAVVWALLTAALHRAPGQYEAPAPALGPADWVTQSRAVLVGGVTALLADRADGELPVVPLVVLASVALVLDAVDGQVARRTGTASALGARFDMEVDAFLILVLSAHVAASFGAWVLTLGAMRYVFVLTAGAAPWLRGALPASLGRKAVAAVQGIVLVVASSGVLSYSLTSLSLMLALASLSWSFGRDTRWLWQHARRPAGLPAFGG